MAILSAATLVYLLAASWVAFSQDLSVPSSWRKASTDRPLSERVALSQKAINAILPRRNSGNGEFNGIGFWQSGNVYSAMVNHDRFAKTTTNRAVVLNNLNKVFGLYSNYDRYGPLIYPRYNDDALWWATSAVYAYRVYKNATMLSHAVATWNNVNRFVITPAHAAAGKHPRKNFVLRSTCDGKTMAGGVFWRPTADDTNVNSVTTGLFITLSTYLWGATKDEKYRTAAIRSARWMESLNINANNIVLDTVHANDCSRSPANWIFTYNSGKYVEGLSVLTDITGDTHWRNLMVKIIAAAVKSAPWQGANGIITEGSSRNSNNDGVGFKAIFIRGLAEVYTRSSSTGNLRPLLRSYIDVQFNALLDLAANGSTYSSTWRGPPQAFTTWGQLAALDVFASAIVAN